MMRLQKDYTRLEKSYSTTQVNSVSTIYHTLVGEHEATNHKFESGLTNIPDLKLVSIAGHGNSNKIYGYLPSSIDFINGEISGVCIPKLFCIVYL